MLIKGKQNRQSKNKLSSMVKAMSFPKRRALDSQLLYRLSRVDTKRNQKKKERKQTIHLMSREYEVTCHDILLDVIKPDLKTGIMNLQEGSQKDLESGSF